MLQKAGILNHNLKTKHRILVNVQMPQLSLIDGHIGQNGQLIHRCESQHINKINNERI